MSDVKMPMWLEEQMRRAMGVNDNTGEAIKMGFQRCYAALIERAPKFDEADAGDYVDAILDDWAFPSEELKADVRLAGIELQRWQHGQDAAQFAALKAENERLRGRLDYLENVVVLEDGPLFADPRGSVGREANAIKVWELLKDRDSLKAENERLTNQADDMRRACEADGYPKMAEESLNQIAVLKDENERLRKRLDEAVDYLKQGKARFAPTTTNSFVDDFLYRHGDETANEVPK